MPSSSYICINGEFIKNDGPTLFTNNRKFRYNDSLSENIHAYATEPQFLRLHMERIIGNMQFLSMEISVYFTTENMHKLIVQLLNKNRFFGGAALRLTVYRTLGEELPPDGNKVTFLLESHELADKQYVLNTKGLSMEICKKISKKSDSLAHIKESNPMVYLLAAMESNKSKCDVSILLNEHGRIVETINSNIFLVSGNSIFTPGLDQGCIPGIMRKIIIDLIISEGFVLNDQSSLSPSSFFDADEVFLTNAIEGISWIGSYGQKRFYNHTARMLTEKLNKLAFKN